MPSWAPSHPNHRCATAVAHLGSPSWAPSWAPVRAVSGLLRAPLGHFGSPPTRPIDVQRPLHIPGPLVDPARARLEAFFGPYGRPSAPSGKTPDLTRRCATAVAHRGAPSWARLGADSGPTEAPQCPLGRPLTQTIDVQRPLRIWETLRGPPPGHLVGSSWGSLVPSWGQLEAWKGKRKRKCENTTNIDFLYVSDPFWPLGGVF